jgi:nitrite reductase (NADH) large subunit
MARPPLPKSYQYVDERKQIYKKIVVSENGKQLLGAVLVGDAAEYGTLLQMALNGIKLPADPEFLILPVQRRQGQARPGRGCLARHGADLLVQQRHQGPDLRGRGRTA